MNMLECYGELPDFLCRAAEAPPLRRLKEVGMNCGCEYTSFPRFRDLAPYSRYAHSVGVGRITWRFTGSARQAMAALCHDIATPCFAHAIDFLNGDHLSQESTEAGTEAFIAADPALCDALAIWGYTVQEEDYEKLSTARTNYMPVLTTRFTEGEMKENKRLILAYYLRCLQLTNAGEGIQAIALSEDEETATIIFQNGHRQDVCIACDSGIAMIKDIARAIS